MRNISTWKDFNDYWKHKNHLQTSSGGRTPINRTNGGGKAKVVCFFKEDIIEKLFLYHTVSIVVMPPTPHPLHPSLCMSSGNREAEGRSLYYWREFQDSCWGQASRAAGEGGGRPREGGGEGPHCVPDDRARIYIPARLFVHEEEK